MQNVSKRHNMIVIMGDIIKMLDFGVKTNHLFGTNRCLVPVDLRPMPLARIATTLHRPKMKATNSSFLRTFTQTCPISALVAFSWVQHCKSRWASSHLLAVKTVWRHPTCFNTKSRTKTWHCNGLQLNLKMYRLTIGLIMLFGLKIMDSNSKHAGHWTSIASHDEYYKIENNTIEWWIFCAKNPDKLKNVNKFCTKAHYSHTSFDDEVVSLTNR